MKLILNLYFCLLLSVFAARAQHGIPPAVADLLSPAQTVTGKNGFVDLQAAGQKKEGFWMIVTGRLIRVFNYIRRQFDITTI